MNKVMKSALAVALCAVMLVTIVACGGAAGVANTKWAMEKVLSGVVVGVDNAELSFTDSEVTLSVFQGEYDEVYKGTYEQNGDNVTMTIDGLATINGKLESDKLTLEGDDDTIVFKKR